MRKQAGFTLPELMMVVAIIAVMAAMVGPSYTKTLMDNKLTSASNHLVMALNIARTEAGKRGRRVTVAATDSSDGANEWGPGWSVFVDTDLDGVLDGGEELLRVNQGIDADITLDSSDNVNFIQYRPAGQTFDSPASRTFVMCDSRTGETGRTITINPVGRVSTGSANCT